MNSNQIECFSCGEIYEENELEYCVGCGEDFCDNCFNGVYCLGCNLNRSG